VPRSRLRSVRYDLDAAIEVARIVHNAGGSIPADLLAPALGYSGTNNGTYLTRLAAARLFGVVGGRGSNIELTDRGRLVLEGSPGASAAARRDAFLAIPLFKEAIDSLPIEILANRSRLASKLHEEFGEREERAFISAGKLIDSARQAGLRGPWSGRKDQFVGSAEIFTAVDNSLPMPRFPKLVKFASRLRSGRASGARAGRDEMEGEGLWLDEEPSNERAPRRLRGRIAVAAAAVVCLAAVFVPVAVALSGSTSQMPAHLAKGRHGQGSPSVLGKGPAEHQVLSALSATTDSGSYDFDYGIHSTPATVPTPSTTTTTECRTVTLPSRAVPAAPSGVASNGSGVVVTPAISGGTETICDGNGPAANFSTPVSGGGVIDVNPKTMLVDFFVGASSSPPFVLGSGSGSSQSSGSSNGGGPNGTLRVDTTALYEDLGTVETTLDPPSSDASLSGQSISSFAGLTESTLGTREGALAMTSMASPNGYLDLYQQEITGADQTSTSSVDGAPVTVYKVGVDISKLLGLPGISTEEATTISNALGVLKTNGYTGTTVDVSVDTSGFIRETRSVAQFSDGGTVVSDVTFSNFGCAGTVLMPGQTGPNSPPAGCESPDTGVAPPTTTTTVPSTTTTTIATTTTIPQDSTTTVAPTSTTSTTLAP
jgi:hypothetical protein